MGSADAQATRGPPQAVRGLVAFPRPLLLLLLLATVIPFMVVGDRAFTIEQDRFVLDGKPLALLASEMHYFRIPRAYWKDRLARVAAMGLNAVQVYVPWNFHEREEGRVDFTSQDERDLGAFLTLAHRQGLLVLLRLGPYMCGEWDFGGLPWWLLHEMEGLPPMKLRTYDSRYIYHVDRYFAHLLPLVKDYLYENGGPVIMVQIENEYGYFGNVQSNESDRAYLEHLIKQCRHYLGPHVVIYTTDGYPKVLMEQGSLQSSQVLTLGDFGPGRDLAEALDQQKSMNPPGKSPFMCTEYYTGWLTHWGEDMANTSTSSIVSTLDDLLSMGGSVSLYMGHGGTNFGFWSGANDNYNGVAFTAHITSYDYDAPVSEGAEHGRGPEGQDKFTGIRDTIAKHLGPNEASHIPPEPPLQPRGSYGTLALPRSMGLFDALHVSSWGPPIVTARPRNMEQYNQSQGFILYQTNLGPHHSLGNLSLEGVRDRAQVWLGSKPLGTVYRAEEPMCLTLPEITSPVQLTLLVENMGRLNFGPHLYDPKGLYGQEVMVSGQALGGPWTITRLAMESQQVKAIISEVVQRGQWGSKEQEKEKEEERQPRFFHGSFRVPLHKAVDTYLDMRAWTKGVVWINGINLGRYWSIGPQQTLYLPGVFLRQGQENDLLVLELHEPPPLEHQEIQTVDRAIFSR